MLEATLKVIISAPELTAVLLALVAKPQDKPAPVAAPTPVAPPSVVAAPTPVVAPTPIMAAPVMAPSPASVPLAAAPTYTIEQLAHAGAELYMRDPVKGAQAQALLTQFGVQAVTELPKERYGEFATALRGLGASI